MLGVSLTIACRWQYRRVKQGTAHTILDPLIARPGRSSAFTPVNISQPRRLEIDGARSTMTTTHCPFACQRRRYTSIRVIMATSAAS